MALPANLLPYGLRDLRLTPVNGDGTYGTMVDLPASRTLSWTDTEDFEQLRGDDQVQAERGNGAIVNWELEQGGISLAAYAVMAGGSVIESGVTPNIIRTYSKAGTHSRPYFLIEGQAINDNQGDTHLVIYRCKATGDIGGSFEDGSFNLTSASGNGYADSFHSNKIYDIVARETAAAPIQPV